MVAAVLFAYSGTLSSWFHTIDDPLHLAGAMDGVYASPHFRPIHALWNRVLWAAFGEDPLGWRVASIALHTGSSLVVLRLLGSVGVRRLPALGGALSFAVCFAPNEVVAWNSASCGQLSVFFVLLSALSWARYVASEKRTAQVGALVALMLALGSKEDAVVAGPLLLGLHAAMGNRRGSSIRQLIATYVPFVVIALGFFWIAFRPELWADRPGVETFELGANSFIRLLGTPGILLWPRHIGTTILPSYMPLLGVVALLGTLGMTFRDRQTRSLALLGIVVMMAGILPVLPGPWDAPAASRYGYPSVIGLAFVIAAVLQTQPTASRVRPLTLGVGAWLLASGYSIRSTVNWRFVDPSHQHHRLVEQTDQILRSWFSGHPEGRVIAIAPPYWNPKDFERDLHVFSRALGVVALRNDLVLDRVPSWIDNVRSHEDWKVITPGTSAPWKTLQADSSLPLESWNRITEERERSGGERELPCFEISLATAGGNE